jgi:hypothetical protein
MILRISFFGGLGEKPQTLLLDSGVLGFHAVHKSPLIYKVIEKEGL